MFLSIIIPAYNEEKRMEENRIGRTLGRISEFFRSTDFSFEVIVVDDGSKDKTVEVVEKFKQI